MSKPSIKTVVTLPSEGYVRIAQILGCRRRGWPPILPLSRSGLLLWVREGRFPAPQKLGGKVIAWPASTIREWLQETEVSHEAAK
jgi:prophage regulatory protein